MDSIKLISYVLIAIQFLFLAWLLSSIKVLEPNGNILIFELILAGSMFIAAIYLIRSQHYDTASKRSINDL